MLENNIRQTITSGLIRCLAAAIISGLVVSITLSLIIFSYILIQG